MTLVAQVAFFNFVFLCSGQNLNSTNLIGNYNHTNNTNNMENVSCSEQLQTHSFEIPTNYTIVFMSLIFLCSILYYIKLVRNRAIYVKHGSIKSYVKTYILIGWKFKSMYGSLFTQLLDQVSDISVILQLYYLSKDENNDDMNVTCYHMNTYYLFLASLIVFLFYRFYSSFLIYRLLCDSNSPLLYKILLTILQFFDLSFFITLKINYKFQNITPCNPQRYITNLESIFEAAPQFIIQLYFIITLNMKQNNTQEGSNINLIVVTSLFFSLISIVSKKLSQDKENVNRKWQNIGFLFKKLKRDEEELAKLQGITSSNERPQSMYHYNTNLICCSFNIKYYIHRIVWRLLIIIHRLILWVLIWRIIGGFWLICCILFEFTFYGIIYFFTRQTVFFESIMGYVLQGIDFIQEYKDLKEIDDPFLNWYMTLSTIVYSIILCVLFWHHHQECLIVVAE